MPNISKHKFNSVKADGIDATRVRPSNWDDEHVFSGGLQDQLLARDTTASDGAKWVKPGFGNLLLNGSFETGMAGWDVTGSGAVVTLQTIDVAAAVARQGQFCIKVQRVGNDVRVTQKVNLTAGLGQTGVSGPPFAGQPMVKGLWVYATVANRARIGLSDGVGETLSAYHPGDSTWRFLTVTRTIDASATQVNAIFELGVGDTTAYIDAAVVTWGTSLLDWQPANERYHTVVPASLVYNGDFRVWANGTLAAPTNWTLTGAGALIAKGAAGYAPGYKLILTRSGADAKLATSPLPVAGGSVIGGDANRVRSNAIEGNGVQFYTIGCWVNPQGGLAGKGRIGMTDGVTTYTSDIVVPIGSTRWITVSAPIIPTSVWVEVVTGDGTCVFSGFTMVEGTYLPGYMPSLFQPRKAILAFGSNTSQTQNLTRFYGPWGGPNTNEVEVSMAMPFKGVARNLQLILDSAPAGGQTVVGTLRKNETTDTALTATVTSAGRTGSNSADEVPYAAGDLAAMKFVTSATSGTRFCHSTVEYEEVP